MSETPLKEDIKRMLNGSPFIKFMDLSVESFDSERGEITLQMPMSPEFERSTGTDQFHGDPISALIDTAGDFAVALAVKSPVPTMALRVDFLRPCTGSFLTCAASNRQVGRSVAVPDIEVLDEQSRMCGSAGAVTAPMSDREDHGPK